MSRDGSNPHIPKFNVTSRVRALVQLSQQGGDDMGVDGLVLSWSVGEGLGWIIVSSLLMDHISNFSFNPPLQQIQRSAHS